MPVHQDGEKKERKNFLKFWEGWRGIYTYDGKLGPPVMQGRKTFVLRVDWPKNSLIFIFILYFNQRIKYKIRRAEKVRPDFM